VIEFVHVSRVVPDDDHVDDQRTLRAHVEREWPPEEIELQITREKTDDVGHHEPDHEKDSSYTEILAPVFLVFLGQLHGLAPPISDDGTPHSPLKPWLVALVAFEAAPAPLLAG
jgi:hypothetical protein